MTRPPHRSRQVHLMLIPTDFARTYAAQALKEKKRKAYRQAADLCCSGREKSRQCPECRTYAAQALKEKKRKAVRAAEQLLRLWMREVQSYGFEMTEKEKKNISKFISKILRHRPEIIGMRLDEHGWADADELVAGVRRAGHPGFDREKLDEIVETNNKKRYSYSEDGRLIRANQGHSIPVDVELPEMTPPDLLWHGTGECFLSSIQEQGILRMSRLYVHLSLDEETAEQVGRRHGKPVLLRVDAGRMNEDGYVFYYSVNGVWLTEKVPVGYFSLQ